MAHPIGDWHAARLGFADSATLSFAGPAGSEIIICKSR